MKAVFVAALMIGLPVLMLSPAPVHAEQAVGQTAEWLRCVQDESGNIHVVYAFGWGSAYYIKYDGSSWIGPSTLPASGPQWFNFTNPDIAVGPNGIPQVVYSTTTGDPHPNDLNPVILATANDVNGTSWSYTTLYGTDVRRNHARIAVDENNDPHIVYMKTNKYEPYWWKIVYRRPDGFEKEIDYGVDSDRVNNPTIAYQNGTVHIAYYRGGSSSQTTNIMHSWDQPYGDFPIEQITYMPYGWFVDTPDIAIDPNGGYHIVYLVADWTGTHGYYKGVHVNGQEIDGGWATIDEGHEDWNPGITFTPSGDRLIGWSHYTNGEAMYKINNDPKVTLTPYGCIDVCGGAAGGHFIRTHGWPGAMYMEQVLSGGPVFYPPTAIIDSIDPSPVYRGIHFYVNFNGSGYDNDESGASITDWEWRSSWDGLLGQTEDLVINPINLSPGRHSILFKVMDDEGEWSAPVTTNLDVFADTVLPPPVEDVTVTHSGGDTVLVEWTGVTDNLAMDHYAIYRGTDPYSVPDTPITTIAAATFPLEYTDDEAFLAGDEVYYLIVPVDIDGNENMEGSVTGGYRFELEDGDL